MPDVAALRRDARDDPARVRQACRDALASINLDRRARLGLLDALGWAELELGNLSSAHATTEQAARLLVSGDDEAVEIGYLSGVVGIALGRPESASDLLHATAAGLAKEEEHDARIEMALAIILAEAHQHDRAFEHYERAIALAEGTKDESQLQRILNNRAILSMQIGRFAESHDDLLVARSLAERGGSREVVAVLNHNLGALFARKGDLPEAISRFDAARAAMDPRSTHIIGPALTDEAQLLLDGGLLGEAQERATDAAELYRSGGAPARQIEAMFLVVRICVARDRFAEAAAFASKAAEIATEEAFDRAVVESLGALHQACLLLDDPRPERFTSDLGPTLDRVPGIVDIEVELGVRALMSGASEPARRYLRHARDDLGSSSALESLDRLVASCGLDTLNGKLDRAVQQVTEGLTDATSNAIALGVTELRSMALRRVRQLASLGVLAALELGQPTKARELLERARSIELLPEPQLSDSERELVAQLRRTVARLAGRTLGDRARLGLLEEQHKLEQDLRSQRRRSPSPAPAATSPTVARSASHLTLDLHIVGQRVCALVGKGADVRSIWTCQAEELRRASANIALALDANAHDDHEISVQRFVAQLDQLLRPVLDEIDVAPGAHVVLDAPIGQIPWSLLTSTPVAIGPSQHHLATESGPLALDSVGIVVGPGLPGAEIEAEAIASMYPSAIVLRGDAATALAVRGLLDEVDLIHFASHGHFRADNPLMSHLEMSTGPITFVDLMEQSRVPARMIFSACHLGAHSNTVAIGLSGLLFGRGCSGFIAAGGPTNDMASAALMLAVHRTLLSNPETSLADALRRAQTQAPESPSMARYLAYGAG